MSAMPEPGPLRDAYIAGALAEAEARRCPATHPHTRELVDYIEADLRHGDADASPGKVLARTCYVFASTLTRAERRAIRRALRGRGR